MVENKNEPQTPSRHHARDMLLKDLDPNVIKNAWFALTHLFLPSNATVADMGCGDGAITYAMAAMRPNMTFIGVDKNRRVINKAKAEYDLPNLEFRVGDIATQIFDTNSLDAIVNISTLHSIYSQARYNDQSVHEALGEQFKALKKEGVMFIRDFVRPPPETFVMIEMPDDESISDDIEDMTEADFLVWYAKNARPKSDPGTGGFFLEELPPQVPNTRLFRLPYQWAYEFILRKNDRERTQRELPVEYTFFTAREFRKALQNHGARVQYSGPHWDDDIIEQSYIGHFKLFEDNGKPLSHPPTGYIAVAQKMTERTGIHIEERRPTDEDATDIHVQTLRDMKTGRLRDVVVPNHQSADIIPYFIDDKGAVKIYLHDDIARSLANAVPRSGNNIDRKRWSAHMIEPLGMPNDVLREKNLESAEDIQSFAKQYIGVSSDRNAILEKGPAYYPAPNYIQDRIHTYFLKIKPSDKTLPITPALAKYLEFQTRGRLHIYDAQQVLDAISIGMIPNATLELQLLNLYANLKIKPESWVVKNLHLKASQVTGNKDFAKKIKSLRSYEKRFKDVKGSAGELRTVRSSFVEEGISRGAISGLSAENVDFVVHNNETVNKALVMPLTKNMKQEIHAGFLLETLPVPEKLEGKTTTIAVPTFTIPVDITDEYDIRKYIATQFNVMPEMVLKMGEPYFCHLSITPQKIYPYALAVPVDAMEDPDTLFLPMSQLFLMAQSKSLGKSQNALLGIARSYKYFGGDMELNAMMEADAIVKHQRDFGTPEWSIPLSYERPPFIQQSIQTSESDAAPVAAQPTSITSNATKQTKSEPKSNQENVTPDAQKISTSDTTTTQKDNDAATKTTQTSSKTITPFHQSSHVPSDTGENDNQNDTQKEDKIDIDSVLTDDMDAFYELMQTIESPREPSAG